ncbi:MAG: glucose-1-phosphate adenylyltransferase [Deltaproteobacteria bacterium]|nr:glucose-1-phosphate adenylyltransferase [Deltaproteobacteria bacterium]
MPNIVALILAGGRVDELSVLTSDRPKSAVPVAGLYRVIDFALSNLMHSRIGRVGILSQYHSTSLITHIGTGQSWDMFGRHRRATLLPPSSGHKNWDWYRGTADAVAQNMEFIVHNEPDLVLILSGDHLYHMNYQRLVDFHLEQKAEVTVGFVKVPLSEGHRFGLGLIDKKKGRPGGRLREYLEKPDQPLSPWASLTIYLFKPQVLFEVLRQSSAEKPLLEFGRDILPGLTGSYRVFGYTFSGYWGYTRTLDEYWQTHMDLLTPGSRLRLQDWQIRTNLDHERIAERQPARIGPEARLDQVLLTPGCEVQGRVRKSVLFPGVVVEKGAEVEDSILFFDTVVEAGARLRKVISDKQVTFGEGCRVGWGSPLVPNRLQPQLLSSGLTVIGHNTYVPAGTRVGANCILSPHLDRKAFPAGDLPSGEVL